MTSTFYPVLHGIWAFWKRLSENKNSRCQCTGCFLFLGIALAGQVDIQFLLHIVGDLSVYGAALAVCHPLGKGGDKGHIFFHLSTAHQCSGIVVVTKEQILVLQT